MLSNAALRRLVAYCRRAPRTPPEFVEVRGEGVLNGRAIRYIGPELRRVVWADVEVRDALLRAGDDRAAWDALLEELAVRGARSHGLDLLDLVTAMSLEAARSTSRVAVNN